MSVQDPVADNLPSDLEEGEIPESEASPFIVTNHDTNSINVDKVVSSKLVRSKNDWILNKERIKNISLYCRRSHSPFERKNLINKVGDQTSGCVSSPSEGEFVSDDEKGVGGNEVLSTNLYETNESKIRRWKYLHPFHTTYGSVEDIMTKIGKTLGRNNNCYYKRRRSKEIRCNLDVGKSSSKGATLREPGPVMFSKFRNSYSKKKRRSGSNFGSESNIYEKSIKMKNKMLVTRRGKGNDTMKKRKRDYDVILGNSNNNETSKKTKTLGKYDRDFDEHRKKQLELLNAKNLIIKPSKEIPVPNNQIEQQNQKDRTGDNGNTIKVYSSNKSAKKTTSDSCTSVYSEEYMINDNSNNFSQFHLNGSKDENDDDDDDDDDDEDDVELIKLRLLALTSNKRKREVMINNAIRKLNDLSSDTQQKIQDNTKYKFSDDDYDDDYLLEESAPDNNKYESKYNNDSDIDTNELLLRAEALKTALLKKHQNRIKKKSRLHLDHICADPVPHNPEEGAENPVKTNEMQLQERGMSHEGVTKTSDFNNKSVMPISMIDIKKEVSVNCHLSSSSTMSTASRDPEAELNQNVHVRNSFSSQGSCAQTVSSAPFEKDVTTEEEVETMKDDTQKNTSKENYYVKQEKKFKKKTKKLKNTTVKEINIKENKDSANEKHEEDDKKLRKQLLNDLMKKKKVRESEKKLVLLDSFQTSNIQPTNTAENKLLDGRHTDRQNASEKFGGLKSKSKMPGIELQRIIVHLGSDSSDEENASLVDQKTKSDGGVNRLSENNSNCMDGNRCSDKIIDYERSVEMLLKEARRRIEGKSDEHLKIPSTQEAVYNHLPPSQRLEYMRLKQKIAEREMLMKLKTSETVTVPTENSGSINSEDKNNSTRNTHERLIEKNFSRSLNCDVSALNENLCDGKELSNKKEIKTDNKKISVNSNVNLSSVVTSFSSEKKIGTIAPDHVVTGSRNVNEPSFQDEKIISKLRPLKDVLEFHSNIKKKGSFVRRAPGISIEKSILEKKKILTQNRIHLERLRILWKNIKIEEMIEQKYEKEIKRLKTQLNFFELKVKQQKLKIKSLAEESKQIYELFQKNNKDVEITEKRKTIPLKEKTVAQNTCKKTIEKKVCERDLEVKSTKDVKNGVSVVKATEENLSEKRENTNNIREDVDSGNNNVKIFQSSVDELKQYSSPLQLFPNGSELTELPRLDPNAIMCQYDLLGKCNDEECNFQHWRKETN